MNKTIVDGYNLIHAIPVLAAHLNEGLEQARNELLSRLRSYCDLRRVEIVVVFDGTKPPPGVDPPYPSGQLQIRFSNAPFKADPLIKNLIKKDKSKRGLTIVSDDSDILSFALANQAKVSSCEAFFKMIEKATSLHTTFDKKHHAELSEQELADWLRLFGEDDIDGN